MNEKEKKLINVEAVHCCRRLRLLLVILKTSLLDLYGATPYSACAMACKGFGESR